MPGDRRRALAAALVAALLFGAATPLLKPLADRVPPLLVSGLLYAGAALAMLPVAGRRSVRAPLDAANARRLAGAALAGGVGAPLALLVALRLASAASVALLLSFEAAATALLGALVFRDPLGRRGWLGVGLAVAAGALLASGAGAPGALAALLVVTACFLWALDNHFTSLIDALPPARTTLIKAAVAGAVSLLAAALLTPAVPTAGEALWVLAVGAGCYGLSIALYIGAAQCLGAVRSQAAFATAPFWGVAVAALFLGERLSGTMVVAAGLAATAVILIARDQHAHRHRHAAVEHAHRHRHDDDHHDHVHAGLPAELEHVHRHVHPVLEHEHRHVPDLHHRHSH
ncbi:DMT family transporter [bacterium]|nr:DMT family transporter [bacterium]